MKVLEKPTKYNSDQYTWQAIYNDGTDLWECDIKQKTTQGHLIIAQYEQIERDKLKRFNVYEREKLGLVENPQPFISIDIKPGYRLIWRKRRFQRVSGKSPFKTIYLIGWQTTIAGQNVQSIIYLDDGKIELSDKKSDYELFNFETATP